MYGVKKRLHFFRLRQQLLFRAQFIIRIMQTVADAAETGLPRLESSRNHYHTLVSNKMRGVRHAFHGSGTMGRRGARGTMTLYLRGGTSAATGITDQ